MIKLMILFPLVLLTGCMTQQRLISLYNETANSNDSATSRSSVASSSTNTVFVGFQYVNTIIYSSTIVFVSSNIVTNPIAIGSNVTYNSIYTNLLTIYSISNYLSNTNILSSLTNVSYSNNTILTSSNSYIPGNITTSGYQYAVDIGGGYTNIDNTSIPIQGTIVLLVNDPDGDDNGAGTITYPSNCSPGIFDIHQFVISADSDYLYFYVAMKARSCFQVSNNQNATGFYGLFLGTYFGKLQYPASTNESYLGTTSPNDGVTWNQRSMLSPGLRTTNVSIQYSACVFGSGSPNIGVVTASTNFFTQTTDGYNMLITTNDILSTGNNSTIYAWRIARGTQFTSGDWLFTAFSFSWEDYGVVKCCPGVEGYLSPIEPTSEPGAFGCGSQYIHTFPLCVDIISTNGNQNTLLDSTNWIWDKDFIPVTLP